MKPLTNNKNLSIKNITYITLKINKTKNKINTFLN